MLSITNKTKCYFTSISLAGLHPDLVNTSIHIEPPIVIWPETVFSITIVVFTPNVLVLFGPSM